MWKQLRQDGKINAKQLGLKFKVIVEPFHPWSFTASVAAEIASQYGGSDAFFSVAEDLWNHSSEFVTNWGNPKYPLANLTETEVLHPMITSRKHNA